MGAFWIVGIGINVVVVVAVVWWAVRNWNGSTEGRPDRDDGDRE